jgi:hypothetical protein
VRANVRRAHGFGTGYLGLLPDGTHASCGELCCHTMCLHALLGVGIVPKLTFWWVVVIVLPSGMILEDMNGAGFSFGDQLSGGPAKDMPPDLAMFRLVGVGVVVFVGVD